MSRCPKCGNYFTGWDCPTCTVVDAIDKQREAAERAAKESRKAARASAEQQQRDLEAQREAAEREREVREEEAESLAWQAEIQAQEQAERLEQIARRATEGQRRIAEQAAREQERIAATAWQVEAQAKIARGFQLLKAGLFDDAIQLLRRATEEDPGNWAGHVTLAVAFWKGGDESRGLEEFRKSVVLLSENFDIGPLQGLLQGLTMCHPFVPSSALADAMDALITKRGRQIVEVDFAFQRSGVTSAAVEPILCLRGAGFANQADCLVTNALELSVPEPYASSFPYFHLLLERVSHPGCPERLRVRYRERLCDAIPSILSAISFHPDEAQTLRLRPDGPACEPHYLKEFLRALRRNHFEDLAGALESSMLENFRRGELSRLVAEPDAAKHALQWIAEQKPSADVAFVAREWSRKLAREAETTEHEYSSASRGSDTRKAKLDYLFDLAVAANRVREGPSEIQRGEAFDISLAPLWAQLPVEDRHLVREVWTTRGGALTSDQRKAILEHLKPVIKSWQGAIGQDARGAAEQEFRTFKAVTPSGTSLGCILCSLIWLFGGSFSLSLAIGSHETSALAVLLVTGLATVGLLVGLSRGREAATRKERERAWREVYRKYYDAELGSYTVPS
jgi:hypothetical protein